jgi:hypothetical protein
VCYSDMAITNESARYAAVSLLLGIVATALLSAQDKPDFSGEWVLESGASGEPDVPQRMSVRQLLVTTNVRGEPMPPFFKEVAIRRVTADTARSETHQIGVVGGSVSGRPGGIESRTQSRTVWEGQSLVFELNTYTGSTPESGYWTSRREVWSRDNTERLRIVIFARSSFDQPKTLVLVYRRN